MLDHEIAQYDQDLKRQQEHLQMMIDMYNESISIGMTDAETFESFVTGTIRIGISKPALISSLWTAIQRIATHKCS